MHRLGESCCHLEEIAAIFLPAPPAGWRESTPTCAPPTGPAPRDQAYVRRQAQAFRDLLERLQNQGIALPKVHLLASHGLLNYPDLGGDYARVGIALYGLLSTEGDLNRAAPDLRAGALLHARVAAVRELAPGRRRGMAWPSWPGGPRKWRCSPSATGDGLPGPWRGERSSSTAGGPPWWGGCAWTSCWWTSPTCPPRPRGTRRCSSAPAGEEVITAYALARQSGSITNEILSRLGPRLERIVT